MTGRKLRTFLAILVALVAAGCSEVRLMSDSLLPSPATAVATPGEEAQRPSPTATPEPSLALFSRIHVDEGWTVVASDDSTGTIGRIRVIRRVRADALVRVYYACEGDGEISIRMVDAEADPSPGPGDTPRELVSFTTDCSPELQMLSAPGPARATSIGVETTVTDPGSRFWALVAVPHGDALPRR